MPFTIETLLTDALSKTASDIHMEPDRSHVRVRFRIDGLLHIAHTLSHSEYASALIQFKTLAALDIAQSLRPQDGRFTFEHQQRHHFRVHSCPTLFGEKLVLRLLPENQAILPLHALGLSMLQHDTLKKALLHKNGLILVTGATGSGKSMTLYSCLEWLKQFPVQITTLEDPVEIPISGITQIPIQEKQGLAFSSALRAVLRQDPDVILVGEIRDPETAEIALRASLTGHLVLSTLHTSNPLMAISRLKNMGISGAPLAESLRCIIAQRLMRKPCEFCQSQGCKECNHVGFKGRTGIFECILMQPTLHAFCHGLLAQPEQEIMRVDNRSLDSITDIHPEVIACQNLS